MQSFMTIYALEQLLTADTWEKKRQVLEEQQALLLTQDAIDAVNALMQRHDREEHPDERSRDEWMAQLSFLITYRFLLHEARTKGIRQAWAEFRTHMAVLHM